MGPGCSSTIKVDRDRDMLQKLEWWWECLSDDATCSVPVWRRVERHLVYYALWQVDPPEHLPPSRRHDGASEGEDQQGRLKSVGVGE